MIDGALPLCIRVMVFAENCNAAKHIYLRGAAVLRKDLKRFFRRFGRAVGKRKEYDRQKIGERI